MLKEKGVENQLASACSALAGDCDVCFRGKTEACSAEVRAPGEQQSTLGNGQPDQTLGTLSSAGHWRHGQVGPAVRISLRKVITAETIPADQCVQLYTTLVAMTVMSASVCEEQFWLPVSSPS